MKILIYVFPLLLFSYCVNSKNLNQEQKDESKSLIKEIKTKNSWHIIYAEKQDSLYKIIVGKEDIINKNCQKITVGKRYALELQSRRDNAPEIGGVKLNPVNYLDIECYAYDKETEICIEPKKGIYELYYTNNLKGLCYLK
jgi:hypothetical protein